MRDILVTHFMIQSTPMISMPLSNSNKPVELFQDDFDMLMAMGLTPKWKIHNSHVVEQGTQFSISRLIVDAKHGQRVRHLDGSPWNLKRTNLGLERGGNGRYNAREKFRNTERPHNLDAKLTHKYINPPEFKEITQ